MSDKEPILNDAEFEIDFQDFGEPVLNDVPTTSLGDLNAKGNTDYKFTVESSDEEIGNIPLGGGDETPGPRNTAFWSIEFYQQYFNVNDAMVFERLMYACMPLPSNNYLEKLKPLPDLYGPLWVCITLIFSTSISGNMADFFNSMGQDTEFIYQYGKVSIAATVIFSYVTVIPALLSGYLWYRKSNTDLKLIDTLSLYGYSLSALIPVSILLCINHEWIRWMLVLAAFACSGVVLLITIWKILGEEPKQFAMIITAVLGVLHFALILLFKMYFFAPAAHHTSPTTKPPAT